ncbi:MAG: type VI secretion system tip protein TssI/VgrG [Acidobacteria bacterium]|nr:type VI secretion system tip protein TssI/VgrG [Acidobacteriota bacterium]
MPEFLQDGSPILITTPFSADQVRVETFEGEEQISGLFHYRVELLSSNPALSFDSIVGKGVTLAFPLASGDTDYRHGIVGRFRQGTHGKEFTSYVADIYPWLWLLTMNADCQIFQNKSAPDIIKQVFSDLGFTDFTDSLTGTYDPREYCVQYMESSFAFVSRLMEEEGIFYFFEHEDGSHKMILADDASSYKAISGSGSVELRPAEASWPSEDAIDECSLEQQVTVGQYKLDDFNFETPAVDLTSTASGSETARAIYEYPGGFSSSDKGEAIAKKRLDSRQSQGKLLRGSGACRAFRAGAKFTLTGHPAEVVNGDYVLQRLTTRANQSSAFSNSFEAFPGDASFRPLVATPRPRIHGAQTATVTGKAGEEIWTDKYGRIVVQFHWDQKGTNDEKSSCWVRVAQGWAGKQWGSFFLPRIGQEVVVSFLDGDPDRPLVTGVVYNAEQTVPYPLPAEQTKSTIKSNSSKGGAGFNELRFEDKKGAEELFMQAQKDFTLKVIGNEMHTVDGLTRIVRVNKGNEIHAVKGTRNLTVNGNEEHANTANYRHQVEHGNYTLDVDGDITIIATGNLSIKADGSVKIEAGKDFSIKAGTTLASEAGTSLTNKAGTSLTNEAGTSLTNKSGTDLTNQSGTGMTNKAGTTLDNKASAMQTVDGGGMLTLKGGLVKIN